ncbi:hypothetical protein P4V41_07040 [Fictibacillus nanhaiensis]|uniref:hypothetical protein n=1 Tax=Fictibacillus nanhaiensis TaxID=742169 RepID=UPI002E20A1EC|nr:hypothetical protein [Fictibacillus nanhaiensis]
MDDFKESTLQRVTRLEERQDNTDKKIEELTNDNKVLGRLTMLMEMQVESNKRQDEQMQKQNETMLKMSHSMEKMSDSYEKLDGRVGSLEKIQSDNKVADWFKTKMSNLLFKIVPTIIATLIGAYLLMRFGLK